MVDVGRQTERAIIDAIESARREGLRLDEFIEFARREWRDQVADELDELDPNWRKLLRTPSKESP